MASPSLWGLMAQTWKRYQAGDGRKALVDRETKQEKVRSAAEERQRIWQAYDEEQRRIEANIVRLRALRLKRNADAKAAQEEKTKT